MQDQGHNNIKITMMIGNLKSSSHSVIFYERGHNEFEQYIIFRLIQIIFPPRYVVVCNNKTNKVPSDKDHDC